MSNHETNIAPMNVRPTLFLQPHYDDVALSCGGLAALVASHGHAADIVTVFASEVLEQMVGDFAAAKHARRKMDDPDLVVQTRKAEDMALRGSWAVAFAGRRSSGPGSDRSHTAAKAGRDRLLPLPVACVLSLHDQFSADRHSARALEAGGRKVPAERFWPVSG